MPALSFGDNERLEWINYGSHPFVLCKEKVIVGQWTLEVWAIVLYVKKPSFLGNKWLSSQTTSFMPEIAIVFESRASQH